MKNFSLFNYVTFVAIGAFIEDFLSEFIKSGIKSYSISNSGGAVYIKIRRRDYKKAVIVARKCNVRIRIYKKHGIKLDLFKGNKNFGIAAGLLVVSLIILITQKFVWKINVYGTNKLSDTLIMKTIAEDGIVIGAYSASLDSDSAEFRTKLALNDISWINIEVNGSRVDVYVNEGEVIEKNDLSVKTPCNVVAGKEGIIVETEVYSGTLLYEKGSGVPEGSVIVSGVVNDGADNLILTHANAKIIAEFNEKVVLRQEFNTIERNEMKSSEKETELMLFGVVIPIGERVETHNNKMCTEEIQNCYFCGYKLPWKIKTNTYTEYEEYEVKRSAEDVNRILEQKLEIHCKNFYDKYEILDINKKIEYDENGMTLTADIKLKGNIAVQKEIMRKAY